MQKKIITSLLIVITTTTLTALVITIVKNPAYLDKSKVKPIPISEVKEIPNQTGGTVDALPFSEIEDAKSMGNLIKEMPLKTPELSFEYNYAKGKFVVRTLNNGVDIVTEFDKWYMASEYKAIPRSRFLLVEQ